MITTLPGPAPKAPEIKTPTELDAKTRPSLRTQIPIDQGARGNASLSLPQETQGFPSQLSSSSASELNPKEGTIGFRSCSEEKASLSTDLVQTELL